MSNDGDIRLPPGWVEVCLGDIAEVGAGGPAPQGEEHFSSNGHPFVRVQDLGRLGFQIWIRATADRVSEKGVRASRLKPVPAGSVLFTKSGMSTLLNQRAILASDAYVVSHIGYATPEPGILSQWLYWALKRTDLGALAHATTLPSLKLSKVQAVKIPVAPALEQRRIVAEIEKQFTRLEAAVAALKRVQANLKRYRAAVLKAAIEGRLVPTEAELARAECRSYEPADELLHLILAERRARWEVNQLAEMRATDREPRDDKWKQKYTEPSTPETAGLPSPPKGWIWSSIGQLFDVHVGATPSRAQPEFWNGDVRWVSSGEVAFCRIKDTREKITQLGLKKSSTELHPPGTVLLGMIGEGKTRGQAAILEIEACNNQNSAAIRVAESGLPPEYLYYLLQGRYEETRRMSSGGNQPALNKDRVRGFVIPLPPLVEQERIVTEVERRLSVIDELGVQVEANLKRAERLRQAVLKRAFEGKLVPQDPSEEPASVLVGRIRAEREAKAQAASKTKMRKGMKRAKTAAAAEG